MKPGCGRPGWDGHLLLLYEDESQRRAEVGAWVRRGLEVGAKILYIEPEDESPARSLSGLLQDQPEAVEAMRRGQIQVISADAAAYDPVWRAGIVDRALRQYPFVRWSGDATTAWGVLPEGRYAEVERSIDEACVSRPVSVMCQYPAGASMGALGPVSAAHGAGLRGRLLLAAPLEGGGVVVSGELDLSNRGILHSVLLAATRRVERDPFLVELSGLDFVDVCGARALMAGTDRYRRLGGQVRLIAPQPQVERLIRLLGVDRAPGFLMGAPG